jgi:hypothetical protein
VFPALSITSTPVWSMVVRKESTVKSTMLVLRSKAPLPQGLALAGCNCRSQGLSQKLVDLDLLSSNLHRVRLS